MKIKLLLLSKNEFAFKKSFLLIILFCSLIIPSRAALNPFNFSTSTGVTLEDTLSTTQLIATNQNNVAGGVSAVTNIGFNFILNGVTYTQFSVNENGLMRLGSTVVSVGSTTANSLAANSDFPKITAYFDDLKTQTGTVRYKLIGAVGSRKLMVQWNVTIGTTLNSKFQVWLFETSNTIQFVYGQNVPTNSANYSVGVATGTTDYAAITVSSTFASSSVNYAAVNDLNTVSITSGNSLKLEPAPNCPAQTAPASAATNINPATGTTLTWNAGTIGSTTGYDVYFGTAASPPIVSTNQVGTTYATGALTAGTVYFWKVNGRNGNAISSGCTAIQFTTSAAPGCPAPTFPAASALNVAPASVSLNWTAGTGTTTAYDVYFGTVNPPPLVSAAQVGTAYTAGALTPGTTYFWKVNGINNGAVSNCSVIQFTTAAAPGCPNITTPAASALNVSPTGVTLNWTAGTGNTTAYEVRFGTVNPPPIVSASQAGLSYNAGNLTPGTVYFWKVNGINNGVSSNCNVVQFTTAAAPGCPSITSPAANATSVFPTALTLNWTAGSGTTTGYDVYFGTAANPPIVSTNQAGTSYAAGNLNTSSTYYWKVVGRNGSLLSSGCTENHFTTASNMSFDVTRSTAISYSSIASTGNIVSSWRNGTNTDDNLSNSIPIGFNFNYGINTFNSFLVSTNGFITFNTATSAVGNTNTPYGYNDSALANYYSTPSTLMLAPFYYDIVCQGNSNLASGLSGSIRYSLSGSVGSRVLTIEWIGMELFISGGPNLNFQVKLYETSNNIDFIYGTMEGFNGTFNHNYSYSLGMSGATISPTPIAGEVFNQITSNTRNFGVPANCAQNVIPECNSRIRFTPGTYTAYVPVSLVPANDNVAGAIQLFVNPSPCVEQCGTIYSSANATNSGIAGCSFTNADDDVWFKFAATGTNTTVKVLGAGNYDATIELFDSAMTSLGCANASPSGSSETLNATLVAGSHYFVRVFHRTTGWNGSNSSGQFSICVSSTPLPPSNDNCANSINLPVNATPVYTTGTSTYSASPSPGIPACSVSGANADDDVWYTFTALNNSETITVIGGTGFNAVIQLFSGSCGSLASIACTDDLGNGQTETMVANNLVRGAVYHIRVFHSGVGGGTGIYSIAVWSPAPECVTVMIPPNTDVDIPVLGTDIIWDTVPGADTYKIMMDTVNPPLKLLATTNGTTITTGLLRGSKTYYWKVMPGNATGYNNTCPIFSFTTEATPYALNVKVFIEGIFDGVSAMKPLINPADTLVDTVTISLVDTSGNLAFSGVGLLSTHGWATTYFPVPVLNEDFYIVINHRNSLEIWSANTFGFYAPDTSYNFSSSAASCYGNNEVQLKPGLFAMYTGDIDQNGFINVDDLEEQHIALYLFATGWYNEDVNFDGMVDAMDYSILENKMSHQYYVNTPFIGLHH